MSAENVPPSYQHTIKKVTYQGNSRTEVALRIIGHAERLQRWARRGNITAAALVVPELASTGAALGYGGERPGLVSLIVDTVVTAALLISAKVNERRADKLRTEGRRYRNSKPSPRPPRA